MSIASPSSTLGATKSMMQHDAIGPLFRKRCTSSPHQPLKTLSFTAARWARTPLGTPPSNRLISDLVVRCSATPHKGRHGMRRLLILAAAAAVAATLFAASLGFLPAPNNAVGFNNRGEAYRAKAQYKRAIADFDEAIHLDPKLAAAFYNRGLAYG